jgi:hypothetical protein
VPIPGFPSGLIANSEGNAHVYYEAGGAVYHWDTLNQNPVLIPGLGSWEDILAVAGGKSGNHFHLIWETTDPDFPGHMNDLFYWRSDMSEAVNISDQAIAPADPTNVEMVIDETDTVHVLWEETAHLYYNSSSELTIQPPAVLGGLAMAQVVAGDGVAYAQFLDSYAADPPFYIWQSDTNEATPVTANLQGGMSLDGDSASASTIWLDSDGLLHIVFEDGSTFNHWDKLRGFQDLAAGVEMESLAHEGIFLSATDSVSGSYLVWQGDTVGSDGNDMYAAFIGPNLPFSVYLPLAGR